MSARMLLRIILAESRKSGDGHADGRTVQSTYGDGFDEAFNELIADGCISTSGPAGTITLSPAGNLRAEQASC